MKSITMRFGTGTVLDEVSLTLRPGKRVGLRGKNGSGKSTLINLATGFLAPTSGQISMAGMDLTGQPAWGFARAGVCRTFQRPRLLKDCVLRQQLGLDGPSAELACEILGRNGSAIDIDAFADELPLASLRLFEVARMLAARPKVLFLDEPSAGLSAVESTNLVSILDQYLPTESALVIAEHRLEFMDRLTDQIFQVEKAQLEPSLEETLVDA